MCLFALFAGAYTGCAGCNSTENYTQDLAIDAVHGAMFVVAGVMGILASLKVGFPSATILTLIVAGIVAVGLTVEIALLFTLYKCSNNPFVHYSYGQLILCGLTTPNFPDVTSWFGYLMYIAPLCISWGLFASLLIVLLMLNAEDSYYFDD